MKIRQQLNKVEETQARLRREILRLRADKAVRIPPERALAVSMGVSRTCLRAALKILIGEGLLFQRQGSGTFVKPLARIERMALYLPPDIKPGDPFFHFFIGELSVWLARDSIPLILLNDPPDAPLDAPLLILGQADETKLTALQAAAPLTIAIYAQTAVPGIHLFNFDDRAIGRQACDILLRQRPVRLVHLAGPDHYASARQRRKGFEARASELGVNPVILNGKMTYAAGRALGLRLLKTIRGSRKRTAVFAANDAMAIGCMQVLLQNDLCIPDQVAILGCDDLPWAAEVNPALSTFRQDHHRLLAEVVDTINAAPDPLPTTRKVLLSAAYKARASTISDKSTKVT